MPHGIQCTQDALRDLLTVVSAPAAELPERLSRLLRPFVSHTALVMLTADTAGERRSATGDARLAAGLSRLELDQIRRQLQPGGSRTVPMHLGGEAVDALQLLAPNSALLVLTQPVVQRHAEHSVRDLWAVVAMRAQELADAASPEYLQLARASSGERAEALTELVDAYSTTLESILAVLRSGRADDAAARVAATSLAASGLVQLRTSSERARSSTEESMTSAFERLRDDLRPLVRHRDVDVQFVAPPEEGRPLPGEVAHGARAVVRGIVHALLESPDVRRVRVEWRCDGTNLLIDLRDDGRGEVSEESAPVQSVRQRIHGLGGRMSLNATAGWGTEIAVVIPLDPPHPLPGGTETWNLRPREHEVLRHLASGRRNRDIAAVLSISENTVKFHIANVYRKLGATSRAEATALFLRA